jgi:putative endonuclease
MITWTVYVLRSVKGRRLYIGLTKDLSRRLNEHNRGYNRSTKGRGPFES